MTDLRRLESIGPRSHLKGERLLAEQVAVGAVKNKSLVMLNRLENRKIQEQLRRTAEMYPNLFLKKPDEILAAMNAAIERERSVTHIMPNTDVMSSYYDRFTGKVNIGTAGDFSRVQREYIEAHEKDHSVRAHLLNTTYGVSSTMSKGFSFWSYIRNKSQQFFRSSIWALNLTALVGPAAAVGYMVPQLVTPSYMHSSWEIYARMSQLKNYFGFDGGEEFTKAHLDYAREHFIKDTGIDNDMQEFFNSITPRSERSFLHIMNNFGV